MQIDYALERLKRPLAIGTRGYPSETRRRLAVVNLMAYLIIFASLNYAAMYAVFDYEKYATPILINLLLCACALLVPAMHRFGDNAAGLFIVIFEYIGLFWLTALLGHHSGVHINYIIAAAVPFLAFDRAKPYLIFTVIGVGLALHLAARFAFPADPEALEADALLLANIYVVTAVTAFGLIAAIVYYALLLKDRAEARTEELLRNTLPGSIADKLKADPTSNIAERYPQATVMFADTVGYTALSHEMGPERTVAMLNDVFTAFDDLAGKYGLEKIKTVGDAYMVVGGVPEPIADHVHRVASMALSLREAIGEIAASHNVPLELRIGIANGPLIGGVIGRRKLLFDVWGDTVNLAARLQTYGPPGKIHISADVAEALGAGFEVERHGIVEIKGFGAIETWFLTGTADGAKSTQSKAADGAAA